MAPIARRNFLELSTDEQMLVLSLVDFKSLLVLRRCSRGSRGAIGQVLRRTLERICGRYVNRGTAIDLLHNLTNYSSYIGGELAACIMLRRDFWAECALNIFVPTQHWKRVMHHLVHKQGVPMGTVYHTQDGEEFDWTETRALESITLMSTPKGRITVYRSSTTDALAPIACRSSTIELCYMNLDRFGHAYPELLFHRRTLLADLDENEIEEQTRKWERRGIEVAEEVDEWAEYRTLGCPRARFLCVTQPRTFTDAGSMHIRMSHGPRPLQSKVVWRLAFLQCGGGSCPGLGDGQGLLRGTEKGRDGDQL